MDRKTLMRNVVKIGGTTLISRMLGLVREVLMANYLGAGIIAEAFITAFKIPNSLRKIFAEGALSVAFIPTFVSLMEKHGKERVGKLLTLALFVFEGFLFFLCLFCIWKAPFVIRCIMPGWFTAPADAVIAPVSVADESSFLVFVYIKKFFLSVLSLFSMQYVMTEKVLYTSHFLQILMFLILFLSTSALIAGVLQAAHNFFIASFSPVLLNIFFIGGIVLGLVGHFSPTVLCVAIMVGALVQLLLHFYTYTSLGFSLSMPNNESWNDLRGIWKKFLPCLISMSIVEIYLFIDTSLGSYLPTGSVATIYFANRFMQIPLSVIASALSTILLPYFSKVGTYAPKRLGFYVFESIKLISWVMMPLLISMGLVAHQIFKTLFLSSKFTLWHVEQTAGILLISLTGVIFFSINKILLNVFYGLHDTKTPMYACIGAVIINGVVSYGAMQYWGAYGIAFGTVVAGVVHTILLLVSLKYLFRLNFYGFFFLDFCKQFLVQLIAITLFFGMVYGGITKYALCMQPDLSEMMLSKVWFWIWYGPLALLYSISFFKTRRFFRIRLHFLNE